MTNFTSAISAEKEGPFSSFAEAFANFWPRAQRMISEGTSLQALETGCWIEGDFDGRKMLLMFYEARDLGYDLGLLVGEGELQNPPPEINPPVVEAAFQKNAVKTMRAMHTEICTTLDEALRILG